MSSSTRQGIMEALERRFMMSEDKDHHWHTIHDESSAEDALHAYGHTDAIKHALNKVKNPDSMWGFKVRRISSKPAHIKHKVIPITHDTKHKAVSNWHDAQHRDTSKDGYWHDLSS